MESTHDREKASIDPSEPTFTQNRGRSVNHVCTEVLVEWRLRGISHSGIGTLTHHLHEKRLEVGEREKQGTHDWNKPLEVEAILRIRTWY